MKESLPFAYGFLGIEAQIARSKGAKQRAFDWDKAAQIIKDALVTTPDLHAYAGLQGDWNCTAGLIFSDGHPVNDSYTYLASNWATPTLIIEDSDGNEISEHLCWVFEDEGRFSSDSKWDESSLAILGKQI